MNTTEKYVIYALCEPNTEIIRYVGKTNNLKFRMNNHCSPSKLKNKTHHNSWMKSLLAKSERPNVIILYEAETYAELDQLEIMWISNCRILGYDLTNTTDGGTGGPTNTGKKFSEEHKRKISQAHLGRKLSIEHKQKIGQRIISQETREKMSRAKKDYVPWNKGIKSTVKCKLCEQLSSIKGLCKKHYHNQYYQNNKEKVKNV